MEDFFFLIPVLFKFPVGLWSQFILQIWNESYKVIGKVFALHFLTSHVLVFGVFSPRRPVTWCPRGTMRRTWSWTRRSRPCVGKMKHWWRGTRWVSVIVVAAESWKAAVAFFSNCASWLLYIKEVEEDKKRAEEEGMALLGRKGKADDLTITISKSTTVSLCRVDPSDGEYVGNVSL